MSGLVVCPHCKGLMNIESITIDYEDEDDGLYYDIYICPHCKKDFSDKSHPFTVNEYGEMIDIEVPMTYAEMESAGQLRLFEVT